MDSVPKHGDRPRKRDQAGASRPAPHKRLENGALIVIVILILAITITRYWHNIHWSAR
jgi:hypothetical protein